LSNKDQTIVAGKNTILIVEDDPKTASLVSMYLERDGFETVLAADGEQALRLFRKQAITFVVLDLMIPRVDGWEVCRQIRRNSDVPILMLTAREDEIDRITGLTLGADDYVIKPFSPRELVARVKAILRRGRLRSYQEKHVLTHKELVLDVEKRQVTMANRPVTLTPHEYKLLQALFGAPGKVFTRNELLDRLYPDGDAIVIDRVVDVHIGKLRQKIEKDPSRPEFILTVRGIGYQFTEGR
jgi:DNA-binding response OmpR family regulator